MTDSTLELDELPYLVGRAWTLGDGVGADDLLPSAHGDSVQALHALVFAGVQPPPALAPGDFLVAGLDIGHGSATRATARAVRLAGAGAIIARSFGAVFLRAALHVGLPPLQVEETAAIKTGDRLRVDIEGHKVVNLSSGDRYVIRNIYGEALDMLRAGGLTEYSAALRGEELIAAVLYALARPLLFRLPAETAHRLAVTALSAWQAQLQRRGRQPAAAADAHLHQTLWGLDFPNPLGLAAGFDKNGTLPHVWGALGFGFAELGTVTAQPQPGNPTPRLFRLPAERALINRLGFNNHGAVAVAAALGRRLAAGRPPIPLGINLGKSRVTPIEQAIDDYRASLAALYDCADYLVVNVSSPNTPGLRDLQSEAQLAPLLAALQADNRRLAAERQRAPRPLLVKLAPDLSDDGLRALASTAHEVGIDGLIATNTTIDRGALPAGHALAGETGGLSGAPLRARATAVIRTLYRATDGRLPIIGVGGIFTADDAYEKIRAGAALVQVYTGFVYQGPGLARSVCSGLRARLARDGFATIGTAVGVDA